MVAMVSGFKSYDPEPFAPWVEVYKTDLRNPCISDNYAALLYIRAHSCCFSASPSDDVLHWRVTLISSYAAWSFPMATHSHRHIPAFKAPYLARHQHA